MDEINNLSQSYYGWEQFPDEWKVTVSNLGKKKRRMVAQQWREFYRRWAQSRIDADKKIDIKLEEVSEALFPGINIITWSIVLTFLVRHWHNEERIIELIENQRNFGFSYVGNVVFSPEEIDSNENFEKEFKNKEDYTIKLVCQLFPPFKFCKIEDYIKRLEEYNGDEKINNRRDEILRIFKKIKTEIAKTVGYKLEEKK